MNLLDRLLGHDLATTRELLLLCATLPDAEMNPEIDGGWGTLRATFDHVIRNIEVWTDLMGTRPVRPATARASVPALLDRLERSYADFDALARQIDAAERWDDLWLDVLDVPPAQKSSAARLGT